MQMTWMILPLNQFRRAYQETVLGRVMISRPPIYTSKRETAILENHTPRFVKKKPLISNFIDLFRFTIDIQQDNTYFAKLFF
jgi:predicted nuclease of restriction endonuclease-like (RecB) superfamily